MSVFRDTIKVTTEGLCSIHDITSDVTRIVAASKLTQGICCVAVVGSTAAISTVEYEPGLIEDIPRLMEKLIPSGISYQHDKTWHDGNGFAHLRSFLIKTSLCIPFDNGILDLGTWQQIILVDFDNRERMRELVVQLVGE
ncbi:MAG TPA: secondary thiamine-phosphate synthase enzyme [candidate division Zixibacteria bacterium]|nr:secondary thiamine-phosphate synthase enzyme [candidate division Zixibacteria bacterium]